MDPQKTVRRCCRVKKEYIKCVAVLTCICLVIAVLLAVTNSFTAPVIAANKDAAVQASLQEVIPGGSFESIDLPEGAPGTVKAFYREASGKGYVAVLSTTSQYSNGDMGITAAIDGEGAISAVAVTSYFESKDFGRTTYPQKYYGATAETVGDVDVFAGATYSSTAFRNALADALSVYETVKGGD